jgi:hypothetical protein
MMSSAGYSDGAILMMIILGVAFLGWVSNIIQLAMMKTLSGMSLLRVIGIVVVPLGIIIGFFPNAPEPTKELVLVRSENLDTND